MLKLELLVAAVQVGSWRFSGCIGFVNAEVHDRDFACDLRLVICSCYIVLQNADHAQLTEGPGLGTSTRIPTALRREQR